MSTTSYSVIHAIQEALSGDFMAKKESFKASQNRLELEYDYHGYDITVTKMCPNCGEEMDFGQAVRCLKQGLKVARKGWNGKGMYLFLATDIELHTEADIGPAREGCTVSPCIVMKTAMDDFQPGWLASQPDMLSDDWTIVE